MGKGIDDFGRKWEFYAGAGRAQAISPLFFPSGEATALTVVAPKFPSSVRDPFPYSGADGRSMTAQAFSSWLKSGELPARRQPAFEELTRLRLDDWVLPLAQFEDLVRRRAGETVGWAELVRHALRGGIKVVVTGDDADLRFQPMDLADREPPPTAAWSGCRASVLLPDEVRPRVGEVRRAWLVADYGSSIFVLDPMPLGDGAASDTRLSDAARVLPRNRARAVGLSTRFLPGQPFDTVVLTFDLDDQQDDVEKAFDGLERELVRSRDPFAAATFDAIRKVLDEAATLIRRNGVQHVAYREPCVIVARPPAQIPTTTKPAHS